MIPASPADASRTTAAPSSNAAGVKGILVFCTRRTLFAGIKPSTAPSTPTRSRLRMYIQEPASTVEAINTPAKIAARSPKSERVRRQKNPEMRLSVRFFSF
jgi:hypothetical protein